MADRLQDCYANDRSMSRPPPETDLASTDSIRDARRLVHQATSEKKTVAHSEIHHHAIPRDPCMSNVASHLMVHAVVSRPFSENTYLAYLSGRSECVVIDPGFEPQIGRAHV